LKRQRDKAGDKKERAREMEGEERGKGDGEREGV